VQRLHGDALRIEPHLIGNSTLSRRGTLVASHEDMIAIVGASGRLGQQLLTHFLGRGYRVNALCRRPRAIRRAADNLTVYRGDVETGEGLTAFLRGCSTVIWAVRCRRPALGMQNLLAAMGERRFALVVMISRLGVGESAAQARHAPGLVGRWLPILRTRMFAELERTESVLRASARSHVILRPSAFVDGARGARVVTTGPAGRPPGPVSRSDFARFIGHVVRDPSWRDSALTVGSAAA
jgi:uncharacterized protein YbjT (DUF2867 family)